MVYSLHHLLLSIFRSITVLITIVSAFLGCFLANSAQFPKNMIFVAKVSRLITTLKEAALPQRKGTRRAESSALRLGGHLSSPIRQRQRQSGLYPPLPRYRLVLKDMLASHRCNSRQVRYSPTIDISAPCTPQSTSLGFPFDQAARRDTRSHCSAREISRTLI